MERWKVVIDRWEGRVLDDKKEKNLENPGNSKSINRSNPKLPLSF